MTWQKGELWYGRDRSPYVLLERPEIAAHIAVILSHWAVIDTYLADFVMLIGGRTPEGFFNPVFREQYWSGPQK